jgi:hypothetical protein
VLLKVYLHAQAFTAFMLIYCFKESAELLLCVRQLMLITHARIDTHLIAGLASDGIDVVVNDIHHNEPLLREVVKEIEAGGNKSIAITGDVSKESEVKAMVAKTVDELGGLDIVRSVPSIL